MIVESEAAKRSKSFSSAEVDDERLEKRQKPKAIHNLSMIFLATTRPRKKKGLDEIGFGGGG